MIYILKKLVSFFCKKLAREIVIYYIYIFASMNQSALVCFFASFPRYFFMPRKILTIKT